MVFPGRQFTPSLTVLPCLNKRLPDYNVCSENTDKAL